MIIHNLLTYPGPLNVWERVIIGVPCLVVVGLFIWLVCWCIDKFEKELISEKLRGIK
jgi:hypothetical protein